MPQARHHLLVLARNGGLDGILDAREEHLPVLLHMEGVGQKWASQLGQEGGAEPLRFRLGFHQVRALAVGHSTVQSDPLYTVFLLELVLVGPTAGRSSGSRPEESGGEQLRFRLGFHQVRTLAVGPTGTYA